jgi:hypothetical protein
MDPKPQKPSLPFANPFSLWTELAFKLWGFGKPARENAPEKQVAVAVIPTSDAAKPKRANAKARRKAKLKSKRAKR